MGRKRVPGLIMRAGNWHIDKRVLGQRICQSTGTAQLDEAERILAKTMEESRQAQVYGVRPVRTFEQAAARFVLEHQHKRSIVDDVSRLKGLLPWIGGVTLDKLHLGVLQPWLTERGKARQTCDACVRLRRRTHSAHVDLGLEASEAACLARTCAGA